MDDQSPVRVSKRNRSRSLDRDGSEYNETLRSRSNSRSSSPVDFSRNVKKAKLDSVTRVSWDNYVPRGQHDLDPTVIELIRYKSPFLMLFTDYIKTTPLSDQHQIQDEMKTYQISSLPVGNQSLKISFPEELPTFFSSPTDEMKNTSLYKTWVSYCQYRNDFITTQQIIAFNMYSSMPWFSLIHPVKTVVSPDIVSKWISSFQHPKPPPSWVVIRNLPYYCTDATVRSLITSAGLLGLSQVNVSYPDPTAQMTCFAIVGFHTSRARDETLRFLQSPLKISFPDNIISLKKRTDSDALAMASGTLISLYKHHLPTTAFAIPNYQNYVGPIQWRQGPVPLSICLDSKRQEKDLKQLLQLVQVFDSNSGHSSKDEQRLWEKENTVYGKIRALVSYLRHVHHYCYWSGVKMTSSSYLTCVVGDNYLTMVDIVGGITTAQEHFSQGTEPVLPQSTESKTFWDTLSSSSTFMWGPERLSADVFADKIDQAFNRVVNTSSTHSNTTNQMNCLNVDIANRITKIAHNRFQCKECSKVIISLDKMGLHFKNSHPNICKDVLKTYSKAELFIKHQSLTNCLISGVCSDSCINGCICGFGSLPFGYKDGSSMMEGAIKQIWNRHFDTKGKIYTINRGDSFPPNEENYDVDIIKYFPEYTIGM